MFGLLLVLFGSVRVEVGGIFADAQFHGGSSGGISGVFPRCHALLALHAIFFDSGYDNR